MAYNFLRGDRDQPFLLPPDLRDWLPDGHLAWFILDVVDQLDLVPLLLCFHRVPAAHHQRDYDSKPACHWGSWWPIRSVVVHEDGASWASPP